VTSIWLHRTTCCSTQRINGDVFIGAGGSVTLGSKARIDGNVYVANGRDLKLEEGAQVLRSMRVASGGTATIRGEVQRTLSVAATSARLEKNGRIGRSTQFAANDVTLAGQVSEDALVAATKFDFVAGAVVSGKLTYQAETPLLAGTAATSERVTNLVTNQQGSNVVTSKLGGLLFTLLTSLVTGLLLLLIAPAAIRTATDQAIRYPWASSGWGLLLFLMLPVVAVLLALVTVFTA